MSARASTETTAKEVRPQDQLRRIAESGLVLTSLAALAYAVGSVYRGAYWSQLGLPTPDRASSDVMMTGGTLILISLGIMIASFLPQPGKSAGMNALISNSLFILGVCGMPTCAFIRQHGYPWQWGLALFPLACLLCAFLAIMFNIWITRALARTTLFRQTLFAFYLLFIILASAAWLGSGTAAWDVQHTNRLPRITLHARGESDTWAERSLPLLAADGSWFYVVADNGSSDRSQRVWAVSKSQVAWATFGGKHGK